MQILRIFVCASKNKAILVLLKPQFLSPLPRYKLGRGKIIWARSLVSKEQLTRKSLLQLRTRHADWARGCGGELAQLTAFDGAGNATSNLRPARYYNSRPVRPSIISHCYPCHLARHCRRHASLYLYVKFFAHFAPNYLCPALQQQRRWMRAV